jgi:hypothetical protein
VPMKTRWSASTGWLSIGEYCRKWVKSHRTNFYIDRNRRLLRIFWPAIYW